MNPNQAQFFESFVPVYDAVPDSWEDAKGFISEQLRNIANSVNVRTIGFLLDEELLSGQQFIPSNATAIVEGTAPQFRSVLRKVVDIGPLVAGANPPVAHGITFNNRFTLIDLWVSGTNSATLQARRITGNDVAMSQFNLTITSPLAFDRAYAFIEYIQEV